MTRAGAAKWQICYPKDKRGDHPVAKPIKTPITYGNYYLLNKYHITKVYSMLILKCITQKTITVLMYTCEILNKSITVILMIL